MINRHYWTLSGYYACYFGVLGVWLPYWPLYLDNLGIGPEMIGMLSAAALGLKVIAPPVWGGLADRGARHLVVVGTSFATVAGFGLFFFGVSPLFLGLVTVVYSFFHAGPLVMVEATTMEWVARHDRDYGRIRLWGSVGFIILSLGAGPILDRWGIQWILEIILLLLVVDALLTLGLPRSEQGMVRQSSGQFGRLFKRPGVTWFYLSTLLMQFSHGAYYGFMSLHLENNGFSRTEIGLLWALGVAAEVGVMVWSRPLLKRFGISTVLVGSIFIAAIRWSIYGFTLWLPLLIIGQLLHAFTFGSFHVAAIQRVFELSPPGGQATAQGWYSAFSFGLGGSMGMIVSGYLFKLQGAQTLFIYMSLAALIGALISWHASRVLQRAGLLTVKNEN
ncbi:MAG: MFS transporter [Magnetococcales bacterium]|nr:MFS transporter [Magnetococcales bacterium]